MSWNTWYGWIPARAASSRRSVRSSSKRLASAPSGSAAGSVGAPPRSRREPDQPHGPLALHHLPRRRVQLQQRVLVLALHEHALADELVDPVAQVGLRHLLQQAVGAELVVAARADGLGVRAAEHVDHVVDAEALLHARHAREDLLRDDRRVRHVARVAQADGRTRRSSATSYVWPKYSTSALCRQTAPRQ